MSRRRLEGAAVIALVSASVLTLAGAQPQLEQPTPRTIYASVTDKMGRPIMDMGASEFEVREGGKVQEVNARPATAPLRVSLIVSDRGSGFFQGGALRFCEALLGHGEISIVGLIAQPETLVDFSTNADALRAGLQQLARRVVASQGGGQVIETILDAATKVNRPGTRPAIVVMRSGGETPSSVRLDRIRDALRHSGAVLYIASLTTAKDEGRRVFTGDDGANMNRFQDLGGRNEDRSIGATILNEGPRDSGGRHIEVAGTTMVPAMQQIAAELINQYEITYTLPAGIKPSDRVSVTTKRTGVIVHAPSRIAN